MYECGVVRGFHDVPWARHTFLKRLAHSLYDIMNRLCTKCKVEKAPSDFHKHRVTKDGLSHTCRSCASIISKRYTLQQSKNPVFIYKQLKAVNKSKNRKTVHCSESEFVNWYNSQPKQCGYCDIPEEYVMILPEHYKMNRRRLAIDSKTNDLGYANGNMILSCGRCNSLKSDVFNYEEFREIAQKYLKSKWEALVDSAKDFTFVKRGAGFPVVKIEE